MIKMGVWVVSSPTELAHYGVKGMRWGVRNEKKLQGSYKRSKADSKSATVSGDLQRRAVEGGYSNIRRLTDNVKRQNNGDGSFNVSGLKGVKIGYFKNDDVYQKWLNGKLDMLVSNNEPFNNVVRTFENRQSNRYSISIDTSNTSNPNDDDVDLEFDNYEDYLNALQDVKNQIGDQTIADVYDTKIDKLKSQKVNSNSVKAFAKKGVDAVKKALDKAGKAAGKKAAELADKGKKALENLLNIKPGKAKTTSLDDMAKAEKTKRQKKEKNSKTVVYDYGAKEVRASPNASMSEIVKKLGGSTKGWKIKSN